jgi:hypothetical protein
MLNLFNPLILGKRLTMTQLTTGLEHGGVTLKPSVVNCQTADTPRVCVAHKVCIVAIHEKCVSGTVGTRAFAGQEMLSHDVCFECCAIAVDYNLYVASRVARIERAEGRNDGPHHHIARRQDRERSPYLVCCRSKVKDNIFGERRC